jgi:hypothetical protein
MNIVRLMVFFVLGLLLGTLLPSLVTWLLAVCSPDPSIFWIHCLFASLSVLTRALTFHMNIAPLVPYLVLGLIVGLMLLLALIVAII